MAFVQHKGSRLGKALPPSSARDIRSVLVMDLKLRRCASAWDLNADVGAEASAAAVAAVKV